MNILRLNECKKCMPNLDAYQNVSKVSYPECYRGYAKQIVHLEFP